MVNERLGLTSDSHLPQPCGHNDVQPPPPPTLWTLSRAPPPPLGAVTCFYHNSYPESGGHKQHSGRNTIDPDCVFRNGYLDKSEVIFSGKQDILWLQVTMSHILFMKILQQTHNHDLIKFYNYHVIIYGSQLVLNWLKCRHFVKIDD